jgi:hypothetical protein
VAQDGAVPARERGGRELAPQRQQAAADGVDAAMDPVQLAAAHAHRDRVAVDPVGGELPRRHDGVLLGGKRGDRDVGRWRCAFCGLGAGNAHQDGRLPRRLSQDHTRV